MLHLFSQLFEQKSYKELSFMTCSSPPPIKARRREWRRVGQLAQLPLFLANKGHFSFMNILKGHFIKGLLKAAIKGKYVIAGIRRICLSEDPNKEVVH